MYRLAGGHLANLVFYLEGQTPLEHERDLLFGVAVFGHRHPVVQDRVHEHGLFTAEGGRRNPREYLRVGTGNNVFLLHFHSLIGTSSPPSTTLRSGRMRRSNQISSTARSRLLGATTTLRT